MHKVISILSFQIYIKKKQKKQKQNKKKQGAFYRSLNNKVGENSKDSPSKCKCVAEIVPQNF